MNGEGRWLPVDEAAKTLGISPDAVRKRMRRGKLETGKGNDGLLRVRIPSDAVQDTGGTVPDTSKPVLDILEQDRTELEALRAQVLALTERAAKAEGELAATNRLVDQLRRELERCRRPWWLKLLGL
jgi:hypothetical protein